MSPSLVARGCFEKGGALLRLDKREYAASGARAKAVGTCTEAEREDAADLDSKTHCAPLALPMRH
jgi:hypothetical protein